MMLLCLLMMHLILHLTLSWQYADRKLGNGWRGKWPKSLEHCFSGNFDRITGAGSNPCDS